MTHLSKTYLGDGVYAACDGSPIGIGNACTHRDRCAFVLTTENGLDITNSIVLEPDVYLALVAFVNRLVRQADAPRST